MTDDSPAPGRRPLTLAEAKAAVCEATAVARTVIEQWFATHDYTPDGKTYPKIMVTLQRAGESATAATDDRDLAARFQSRIGTERFSVLVVARGIISKILYFDKTLDQENGMPKAGLEDALAKLNLAFAGLNGHLPDNGRHCKPNRGFMSAATTINKSMASILSKQEGNESLTHLTLLNFKSQVSGAGDAVLTP